MSGHKLRLTRYARVALAGRREIKLEYIERTIARPVRSAMQPDGRRRLWGYVQETSKWLRVILLPDGTVHNAFFDRRFKP